MSADVLLDTHMLLWLTRGDERAAWVRPLIEDAASTVSISAVSLTEIAVKASTGKLPERVDKVRAAGRIVGLLELPFTAAHAEVLAGLPLRHRDPFDRMLIAQAISEGLTVLTADRSFHEYDGLVIRDR